MRLVKNDCYTPFNAIPNPKSYLPQHTQEVLAHQRAKRARNRRLRHVGSIVAIIVAVVAILASTVRIAATWNW